jgi:hypothetical protein
MKRLETGQRPSRGDRNGWLIGSKLNGLNASSQGCLERWWEAWLKPAPDLVKEQASGSVTRPPTGPRSPEEWEGNERRTYVSLETFFSPGTRDRLPRASGKVTESRSSSALGKTHYLAKRDRFESLKMS